MSEDWQLRRNDCGESFGPDINHGEEELARLLARREELAAVGHVDGLTIEVWGEHYAFPAWFAKHAGHNITVRSEYGHDFGDCARYGTCGDCGHRFVCRLPAGHEGDHAPKVDQRTPGTVLLAMLDAHQRAAYASVLAYCRTEDPREERELQARSRLLHRQCEVIRREAAGVAAGFADAVDFDVPGETPADSDALMLDYRTRLDGTRPMNAPPQGS